jgi:hypothetical protein
MKIYRMNQIWYHSRARFATALTPYLWQLLAIFLKLINSDRLYFTPNQANKNLKCFVLSQDKQKDNYLTSVRGVNLTHSIMEWVFENAGQGLPITKRNLKLLKSEDDIRVLVICHDWYAALNRRYILDYFLVAYRSRRRNIRIWAPLADTFDMRTNLPLLLMVQIAGGALLLQANCICEAKKFRLLKAAGHFLWTTPPDVRSQFKSEIDWEERPRKMILAFSGDKERLILMSDLEQEFRRMNWEIIANDGQQDFVSYAETLKHSRIVVTTNTIGKRHLLGPRSYVERIPRQAITHRTWDSFMSGNLLVTNQTHLLELLGFFSETHFIELFPAESLPQRLSAFSDIQLKAIANAGHEKFLELVERPWGHSALKDVCS